MTHPYHPLFKRRFAVVEFRHNWGDERVFFHDAEGVLMAISARWTDVVPEDPFVAASRGRAHLRFEDFLAMRSLLSRLLPRRGPQKKRPK